MQARARSRRSRFARRSFEPLEKITANRPPSWSRSQASGSARSRSSSSALTPLPHLVEKSLRRNGEDANGHSIDQVGAGGPYLFYPPRGPGSWASLPPRRVRSPAHQLKSNDRLEAFFERTGMPIVKRCDHGLSKVGGARLAVCHARTVPAADAKNATWSGLNQSRPRVSVSNARSSRF